MSYKVLIIGAGAVGVAMAASLSEEGMDVTVYSKATLRTVSRRMV